MPRSCFYTNYYENHSKTHEIWSHGTSGFSVSNCGRSWSRPRRDHEASFLRPNLEETIRHTNTVEDPLQDHDYSPHTHPEQQNDNKSKLKVGMILESVEEVKQLAKDHGSEIYATLVVERNDKYTRRGNVDSVKAVGTTD